MRTLLWLLAGLATVITAPAGAQGVGLTPPAQGLGGPVWQARFESDPVPVLAWRGVASPLQPQPAGARLRLLGDMQFSTLRLGDAGGLRLTGGLLVPLRQLQGQWLPDGRASQPYAGVGYSSASLQGGWGISADLGLAATGLAGATPGLRADRGHGPEVAGSGGLRLQPLLRVDLRLAF